MKLRGHHIGIIGALLLVLNAIFVWPHHSFATLLDCSTAVNITVPVQECVGLVDLYNTTNGASWTTSTNWNTDTNICTWYGVTCALIAGVEHVTNLNLSNNNLVGTLPSSMSGLQDILVVSMSQNGLTGILPPERSTWTGVQALQIYSNAIVGTLPATWSSWEHIENFQVLSNQLTGILPPEWSTWTGMKTFLASNNHLSGTLPASWSGWTITTDFEVDSNQLTGILPPEWSTWTGISTFKVAHNMLTGTLPTEWSAWTGITDFEANSNLLTGTLPTTWSTWTGISIFHVNNNNLVGTLPTEWSNWTGITDFNVYANNINGILPSSWSTWGKINTFNASQNNLTGTLPTSWATWTGINSLQLHDNGITGTLPTEWSAWTGITDFSVAGNTLVGTFPTEWSAWTGITNFSAAFNSITGSLPTSWSAWTGVVTFYANSNTLVGTLPSLWSGRTNLQEFHVDTNNITGSLPTEWASWNNIINFYVNGNSLVGTLPSLWGGNWTTVTHLALNNNFLTGEVPASWTGMDTLVTGQLFLSYNCLTTSLPEPPATFVDDRAGTAWKSTQTMCGVGTPTSDLVISKAINTAYAASGDTIVYTITYTNSGAQDVTGVTVTDTFPTGFVAVYSSPAIDSSSGSVYTWNIGNVAANTSGTIILSGLVGNVFSSGTVITNTATISGELVDLDSGNNSSAVNFTILDFVPTSDLIISKSADNSTPLTGDEITYTIVYTNSGSEAITGITISDTIPTGVTYLSASPTPTSTGGTTLYRSLGGLNGNTSGTIVITGQIDSTLSSGTSIINSAYITGILVDTDSTNDTGSATITVLGITPIVVTNGGGGRGYGGGGGYEYTPPPVLGSAPIIDNTCIYQDGDFEKFKTTFSDAQHTIFKPAVDLMLDHCLVQGYKNKGQLFGVNDNLKWGEAYKVFARLAGLGFNEQLHPQHWSDMYKYAGDNIGLRASTTTDPHPVNGSIPLSDVFTISNNLLKYFHKPLMEYDPSAKYGKPITRGKFALWVENLIGLLKK